MLSLSWKTGIALAAPSIGVHTRYNHARLSNEDNGSQVGTHVRNDGMLLLELDTCVFGGLLSTDFIQVFGK